MLCPRVRPSPKWISNLVIFSASLAPLQLGFRRGRSNVAPSPPESSERGLGKCTTVRGCVCVCNCTHSCSVLAPHAPHGPVLCVFQGVPLFYRCCSGGYTSQVHHTSPAPSLTSNMLVGCDPLWQPRATTLHVKRASLF